jgi:hypothetical protein
VSSDAAERSEPAVTSEAAIGPEATGGPEAAIGPEAAAEPEGATDATLPEGGVAPAHPSIVGPTIVERARVTGPSLRRSIATIALFAAGLVVGVVGFVRLNAPPQLPTYPPLAGAPEPQAAHALAAALGANDAQGIADHLMPGMASDLSTAIQPIVDITSVTYLGTVEQDGRELAGYVVQGRDNQGAKQLAGLVLDVSGGEVVAINQ